MSRPAWTSWLSCVACVRFTGMEASCEPASCTSRYQTFWALRRSWYPTPGRSGVQRPEAKTRIRCAWPRGRRFEQSVFYRIVTNYDYYLTEINRSTICSCSNPVICARARFDFLKRGSRAAHRLHTALSASLYNTAWQTRFRGQRRAFAPRHVVFAAMLNAESKKSVCFRRFLTAQTTAPEEKLFPLSNK